MGSGWVANNRRMAQTRRHGTGKGSGNVSERRGARTVNERPCSRRRGRGRAARDSCRRRSRSRSPCARRRRRELALGFLYAEGVITSIDDVGSVAHAGDPTKRGLVTSSTFFQVRGGAWRPSASWVRAAELLTTSACGVCGRLSIEYLVARCSPVSESSAARVLGAGAHVRVDASAQRCSRAPAGRTRPGCSLVDGDKPIVREDVGRHNAIEDKVVGAMLLGRRSFSGGKVLIVSGRASFEIVFPKPQSHEFRS